jgi:exonuclease III
MVLTVARRASRSSSLSRKTSRFIERLVFVCFSALVVYFFAEYQSVDRRKPMLVSRPSQAPQKPGSVIHKKTESISAAPKAEIRVMTWNLDWFQDPNHGPRDDFRQYQGVKRVLQDSRMSLIGLVEVSSQEDFDRLISDLGDYSGVLSSHRGPQKTGLLFAKADFELEESRPLTALTTARRPPLEVVLRSKSKQLRIYVVVIHAKARDDLKSYGERVRFSHALKAYLDYQRADVPVIVLGDFNDLLSGSITRDMPSPYQNFVDDRKYLAATRALNIQKNGERSGRWGSTIDHIIISDELAPHLVRDSVDVVQREMKGRVTAFTRNVSDHYPVTLTLRM